MNGINKLLEEFYKGLISSGWPLTKYLQNGINRQQINQNILTSRISFPDEVYELYEWRNGLADDVLETKTLGELQFFRFGIFPNFETSFQEYIDYSNAGYWNKMLFPLFGSGAGDYYLIDCANNNQTQGTIFYFSPSDPDFDGMISIYDSLDKLLHTVSECYKLGAYFFNDNQLQIKYELEKEISINKNPESHFWKL